MGITNNTLGLCQVSVCEHTQQMHIRISEFVRQNLFKIPDCVIYIDTKKNLICIISMTQDGTT